MQYFLNPALSKVFHEEISKNHGRNLTNKSQDSAPWIPKFRF
jgi:hypothetical protein